MDPIIVRAQRVELALIPFGGASARRELSKSFDMRRSEPNAPI
jgi:hypothetical protein